MPEVLSLNTLSASRFDRPDVLRKLAKASRQLAELKGVAGTIPHQGILINTLGLREAKDSSAIENIVTTHDELFKEDVFPGMPGSAAAKEVQRYRQALRVGFDAVQKAGLLTLNHILQIQAELEQNSAGFRKLPGTVLANAAGETVYVPPQDEQVIKSAMSDLEKFINSDDFDVDPLIRMALIHHQFETIHPFYDGNGRTGRILNVLYLVKERLLEIPVLYLSRYIVRTKTDYYSLLQAVRDRDAWEEWVLYMLTGVEESSREAIGTIVAIRETLLRTKHEIRQNLKKIYSQDLINNLFTHPYTKIEFIQNDLGVSRLTATRYLDALTDAGFLQKQKVGRSNYYINLRLLPILSES